MWSMPVDLTKTENENNSVNQNDAAKMMLQNDIVALAMQADSIISPNKHLILNIVLINCKSFMMGYF